MPNRILIVDDEETVRDTVASYLRRKGFEPVVAADGAEAIEAIEREVLDFAIVDFLLPGENGFKVAEAIRESEINKALPILMVSGVFKNPMTCTEARKKFGVVDFLAKPLDLRLVAELIAATLSSAAKPHAGAAAARTLDDQEIRAEAVGVSEALARRDASAAPFEGEPLPSSGNLDEYLLPIVLGHLRHVRATGMLDLLDQAVRRRLYIQGGKPIFVQSNAEGENVADYLLEQGRITEADMDRIVSRMQQTKDTLQKTLLEFALVDRSGLADAYAACATSLFPQSFAAQGRFAFESSDAFLGKVPSCKIDFVTVVPAAVVRHTHPDDLLGYLGRHAHREIRRTIEWPRHRSSLEEILGTTRIERLGREATCFAYELSRAPTDLEALATGIFVATALGALTFGERIASQADVAQPSAQSEELLAQEYRNAQGRDPHGLFGLSATCTLPELRHAYFQVAARWLPLLSVPELADGDRMVHLRRQYRLAYSTIADSAPE